MAGCLPLLQSELQSFMEVLLKAIVWEVAEVFRDGAAAAEGEFQRKLRGVPQLLARRAVFRITQCVEETLGREMAQMKRENEILKVRLHLWEKEQGAGGDRGQTDRDGHTPPCQAPAEIKEEMDTEPELSGSEVSALPDAGDRAPLEQQPSKEEEEEGGSRLMQETELAAAHGKETLSEQQHTESRQRVGDLDSVSVMKTEPESETPGLLVSDDFTEKINHLDTKNIAAHCIELGRVSVQEPKEELGSEVSALPDAGDRAPLEQQPSEEEEEEGGSRLMQETELAAAHGKETLGEQQHTESRQRVGDLDSVPVMKTEPETETPGFLLSDLTETRRHPDACFAEARPGGEPAGFGLTQRDQGPRLTAAHPEVGPGVPQRSRAAAAAEKRFGCAQCGRGFSRPAHLAIHRRVHTGERAYSCAQCGRSFGRPDTLKTHLRVHTGERPFACPQCGKSFTHSNTLKTHLHIHTGAKPFACPQCGKSFRDASTLRAHRRTHLGDRPFGCPECGRRFNKAGGLRRHQHVHAGGLV
ncbi:uncharacterized protein [Lepisosteus oculatus]|uniref:uncharacterized protein n=1 Tax=Lepisosteus oculatus TaxID=7918 RepID=UPI0035F51596